MILGSNDIFSKTEIQPKDGAILDGVGYLHGHMYPSPQLAGHLIVVGHHHPLLSLKDEVGCAIQAPAYLRAGLDAEGSGSGSLSEECCRHPVCCSCLLLMRLPVMISFRSSKIRSHLFRDVMKKEEAEIILADGTYIGPVSSLHSDETD